MSTRSYGQYCGLARALDVISGRWSLLIVRELLAGPARYARLQAGLPGISTNLLAERLRELEGAGVIERQLDPHSNGVAYALTPWGSELRATITALVSWSTPLMVSGPQSDSFQPHWLVVALESLLADNRTGAPATVGVEAGDAHLTVRADPSGIHVTPGIDEQTETVFSAEPMIVMGLASGTLTVQQAIAIGQLRGSADTLATVLSPH